MAQETFGERLRRLREAGALSQEQLGEIVGVTGQAIHMLEIGKRSRPQPANLRRLAEALDVTPEYLMFGVNPQADGHSLPPLDTYLRETQALTDEQITHVRRTLRALQAERELAEFRAKYEAEPQAPQGSAGDRRNARGLLNAIDDVPEEVAEPEEGEDFNPLEDAAYDRDELAEKLRREGEGFEPA
jgi:transcriptional regulator with XRE-family HTH domain